VPLCGWPCSPRGRTSSGGAPLPSTRRVGGGPAGPTRAGERRHVVCGFECGFEFEYEFECWYECGKDYDYEYEYECADEWSSSWVPLGLLPMRPSEDGDAPGGSGGGLALILLMLLLMLPLCGYHC